MSRKIREAALKRQAEVFAALGDKTRLTLVRQLGDGEPRSISKLTEGSDVTRQAITKHLHVLEEVGLVRQMKSGRESLYTLNPEPLDEAQDALQSMARQWDEALVRLKSFLEDGR
ncbi:MAG TPA: metalloregulator ArsR/SmtB family transcription factor [Oligoflexus sp.]|uniref:ArsR/SmtB family transcription factor n=1 Tax=Oligoflexus sp. TaxID=1971216 RepID=UPI002D7ED9C6|nr:metalloregulator ArsR/SmtB family transcription factor [Oligoflexus sp.]HET9237324.1 metalloregulator ArsR/SmtB family transcription factor [Oligoflexus sp.]